MYNDTSGIQESLQLYTKAAGNEYGLRMTMSVSEVNDGYQHVKLVSEADNSRYVQWNFEIKKGDKSTNWHSLYLPIANTQGEIYFTDRSYTGMDFINTNSYDYVKTTMGENLRVYFDSSGTGDDDWKYTNLRAILKIFDTAEPTVKRITPMAYGTYKKGDTVTIAVEFNEIIASASNVTMNKINVIPVSSWAYLDGAGTNVLVFKGTLTNDFTVDPNMNMTLTGTKPAVSGTIKDIVD